MRGGEGTPPSARGGERGGVPGGARVASAPVVRRYDAATMRSMDDPEYRPGDWLLGRATYFDAPDACDALVQAWLLVVGSTAVGRVRPGMPRLELRATRLRGGAADFDIDSTSAITAASRVASRPIRRGTSPILVAQPRLDRRRVRAAFGRPSSFGPSRTHRWSRSAYSPTRARFRHECVQIRGRLITALRDSEGFIFPCRE